MQPLEIMFWYMSIAIVCLIFGWFTGRRQTLNKLFDDLKKINDKATDVLDDLDKIREPQIKLDKYETMWIKLIKGHLWDKYPPKGRWHETLKPMFIEHYRWDPDEGSNYNDYLYGMFNKLLDVYMKIKDRWTDENGQLKEIFDAVFSKGISYDEELPRERAIHKLCGLIQCNKVINEDGTERYKL